MDTNTETTPAVMAVSVEKAAFITGVGRTILYQAIATHDLRSLKVGKRRLIRIDDLNTWLDAHEVS
jgi:excisionase family DNA binding protein